MTKLSQIVAIEKGVKAQADSVWTAAYHTFQKEPLLSGIARTYQPKDDAGDTLPPESTLVQIKVEDEVAKVVEAITRKFDVTLTKDTANCNAKADVVVDGVVVLAAVPVTYLLFLEKQLVGLQTFVSKLPTLDPAFKWTLDANAGAYATDPVGTTKTKKVPRNWVKAEATDKHPAQVEVYHEDIIVGTWTTTKFSGAVPADRVVELSARVAKLQQAVKFAREEANGTAVVDQAAGAAVLGYIFS